MSYIIPVTIVSLVALFLTTIKKTVVLTRKNEKATVNRSIDMAAFTEIVRQVVIVFLSAVLAMWLTEYVEQKTVKNRMQDFVPQIQISVSSQIIQVGGEITDIDNSQNKTEEDMLTQMTHIIKQIQQDDMPLWETMLYNESFLTVLDPLSYMHLNMDFSQMRHIKEDLSTMDISAANKQAIADKIAGYLYYGTDAAFCLEFLCEDIEFNLMLLAMLEDENFDANINYRLYNNYLEKLEVNFGVDMSEWKGKRQFSKHEAQ